MSLGLAFWILMCIWLAFGVYQHRAALPAAAGDGFLFILLVLLGWAQFGAPIRG